MLRNLVEETANNPGAGTNVTLGGGAPGRRSFAQEFTNGQTPFYFLFDGTLMEAGLGTFVAGAPNVLQRTTVLWNSAGTTARLSFTGALRVYNSIPASVAAFFASSGDFLLRQDPLVALAAATKQYVDAADVTKEPLSKAASGVGEISLFVSASGGAAVLPAGGTWSFWINLVADSTLTWSPVRNCSVLAGGSTAGAAVAGGTYVGWKKRIT